MAELSFDDLVPKGGVSFDDLIPPKREGQHLSFEEGQKLLAADERKERMEGATGTVGAALTGFGDGVPIVGPALLGAGQRGGALAATVLGNGRSYDENLKDAQAITAEAQDAHPYVTTGSNVAGAVAGTIPMVMAAPAAFGGGGGSLLLRSGLSGLSGAAIGGADAGVRSGGDADAMWNGARNGLLFGVGGPIVAKGVGAGFSKVVDAVRARAAARAAGLEPKSLMYVTRAATDDGLDATAIQSRLADMGPDAVLADLGPNLQHQAGALAATPGRAQEVVRKALVDRQAGANTRIGAAIDDNLGPRSIVPSEVEATIQGNQQALGPQYGEVFRNARAVDTAPIAGELESQIVNLRGEGQRAAQRVRGMLDINGAPGNLDPNPGTLFQTRQAIDGYMATETNPQAIRVYANARQQIDDMLANAVPQLKEVDANFAELARQREALQRGQTVLSSGREAPRPSELVNEVQQGAQPQGLQIGPSAVPLRLSQGARAEVERIVGTNSNDVAALNRLIKGEGDWNRARLATLFGQDKADRLIKVLDNERVYADTANTVTRNSETAARMAAQGELGVGGQSGFSTLDSFKAGGIRGAARSAAVDKVSKIWADVASSAPNVREDLARALVDPQRDALIQAIAQMQKNGKIPAAIEPVVKALMLGTGTARAR